MDNNMLEYYVKEYTAENFLVNNDPPASRFFHGMRMNMDESMGQGWSEMLRIHNGLYVTLADYRLSRQVESCHIDMQTPFQLNILLSGNFESWIPGQKKQRVAAGDIAFAHGFFEKVLCTQFPDEEICGVSIGLPRDLVESWLGNSCCNASKGLEKLIAGCSGGNISRGQTIPLARGLRQSSDVMRIARELIHTRRQILSDNLRFESLALDLLSRFLTLENPAADSYMERAGKIRAAVDEAVDILHREWNDPPTISALARRVGVNECYLKRWFRQRMGMPIGAYICCQRMIRALEMIETGRYSILEISLFVGYSNSGHFTTAFKKFYGHPPSYYLPRDGRASR